MNINNILKFKFKARDGYDKKLDDLLTLIKDIAGRHLILAKDVMRLQIRVKELEGKLMSVMDNNVKLIELIEKEFAKLNGGEMVPKEDKNEVHKQADANELPNGKE